MSGLSHAMGHAMAFELMKTLNADTQREATHTLLARIHLRSNREGKLR